MLLWDLPRAYYCVNYGTLLLSLHLCPNALCEKLNIAQNPLFNMNMKAFKCMYSFCGISNRRDAGRVVKHLTGIQLLSSGGAFLPADYL
eukprot:scaffold42_cov51-Cyclotella_meneghiniana.AAC.2